MHASRNSILVLLALFLFTTCTNRSNKTDSVSSKQLIRIKGSDTEYLMVKELAETFMHDHPTITIDVEGGGSNAGMTALAANEIDILNSSREIRTSEIEALSNRGIQLIPIQFSSDALAIVTNYQVGVDSLSTEQVSLIFQGKVKNWAELGGDNCPIALFGRDLSSGTRDYFMAQFLSKHPVGTIRNCISNSEVVSEVIRTKGGIGYVGAGFLFDASGKPNGKLWAMPIYIEAHKAISPYESNKVKHGDYVLTRPLFQYINGKPTEAIEAFVIFEISKRGQEIVSKHGFFTVVDCQSQINRLKGLPSL
jgi:phosphate transport system substrate-binding protein